MKKRKLYRTVIITALVALTGLLVVQVLWFFKAYEIQEKQFDEKVNLALRHVADEMMTLRQDTTTRILPVTQSASNVYYVDLNRSIDYPTLDSLLRVSFRQHDVLAPFELTLYDNLLNTILLGNYYEKGIESDGDPTCRGRTPAVAEMDFAITFPGKRADIIGAMGIWIFTASTFLLILVLFSFMMLDLSKQKKLSEMKSDFINNMTHELQTPIANISVASEVLRSAVKRMDETKARHYADIIYQENRRLKFQVEQVLQTASFEKGELELRKTEVDINQLVEEVIRTFQVRVTGREGQIHTNLMAQQPVVLGDPFHLTNIFYSLLDNAEKYSPGPPNITVTTKNKGDGLLIAIADKGIGIGKDVQKYIFDKFYRAPSGNVHDVKGFGLGLTYVHKIVTAHHGNVSVTSELNKGSLFELYFKNS